jgi:hypothetical protein
VLAQGLENPMSARLHRKQRGRMICLVATLMLLFGCGSDPGGASGPSSEQCAEQRNLLVQAVREPLQQATDKVMASLLVMHRRALGAMAPVLRRAKASECVADSAALDTLVHLAHTFDIRKRQMKLALAAFDQWARSMGSPEASISLPRNPCTTLGDEVRASYRVNREPEDGGVRISLELVLENDSSRRVDLYHGGKVRATHVRPQDQTSSYAWGGSSADSARAAPGHATTQLVDLLPTEVVTDDSAPPGPELHLFPSGRVEVYDVYGYSGPCNLKVSRAR